jgi:class 3 adenylate cyclase/TolB-like protein
MSIERKLAAIMFTDIAGYTEAMSKSESKSLDTLEKKRSILKPLLKEYKGTFVKEIGDGTLSYFESAVNAATCAVKLQETTYDDKDMNIRVGIHIGDIVFKDGDVFGGGVNVASRLESIAPAGGVCVSKSVYEELSNQDDFDGIELGLQSLKGVGRLVEVFGLKGDKLSEPNPNEYQENKVDKHTDDEVPSIAIIPFENKGAEEDVFYAYGVSADLISDVSSAGLIRVPSLKRVEEVADLSLDEKATKLDVRYTCEGTLWKMGEMFQLSVELYDTKDKKVVWSDRWQENWDNLPTIKMNLSDGLLKSLDMKLTIEKKVETANTEAYEFYLKGKYKFDKQKTKEDLNLARGLLNKAIKLDNNLLEAKNILGRTYYIIEDYDKALEIFEKTLKQAETLEDRFNTAYALVLIGFIYDWTGKNDEKILSYYKRALKISEEIGDQSSIAHCLQEIGSYYGKRLDYDMCSKYNKESLSLYNTLEDKKNIAMGLMGQSEMYIIKGNYTKAIEIMNKAYTIGKETDNVYHESILEQVLGTFLYFSGDYRKALTHLKKSVDIMANKTGENIQSLEAFVMLALTKKTLGLEYDIDKNMATKYVDQPKKYLWFVHYYVLYLLFEDRDYLKLAYDQMTTRIDILAPSVKEQFLSYPIPKAIVEEYKNLNYT